MNKNILIAFVLLAGLVQSAYGQDFKARFQVSFDKRDLAEQEKILKDWEKANSNDPELYVSYFNFYFHKSRNETLTLTTNPASPNSIVVTKENDSESVAYLGSQTSFNKTDFDKGIEYVDKGIAKFPNRLDMRFGKVFVLGQIADYKTFTTEIIRTIEYSKVNDNQWFWTDNRPAEKPKTKMLLAIQDYVVQLFNAGDEYAENIKSIAEAVLKYYPESVENLSNLAIAYMIREDYDNALVPLLKAEKLAPTDYVVLNNIAWSYYYKGDTKNAVKYFDLVVKYGNEEARAQAKAKLVELKSKN